MTGLGSLHRLSDGATAVSLLEALVTITPLTVVGLLICAGQARFGWER